MMKTLDSKTNPNYILSPTADSNIDANHTIFRYYFNEKHGKVMKSCI